MTVMWFQSIEASRFRQFRDTICLRELTPGLNVIAGDNEEGKSTLLGAIRAALFDRYTSSVAGAYRPYGEHVSPQVMLIFEVEEVEYTLHKVFSRKRDGKAMLTANDGRRWEGPQAEEFLAELLGFTYAQRGASKPEQQGLAGLLWVEQARAYQEVSLTDQSRCQLHTVFDTEISELLGGEHGEVLHRRIAELRSVYFDKRGKPRGEYRQLQDKRLKLVDTLEKARLELKEYETKTDRLDKLQSAQQSYQDDRIVEKAQEKLRDTEARHARVQTLEDRLSAADDKLARARAEQEAARLAWETRTKLVKDQQQMQSILIETQELLLRKEKDLDPALTEVQELKQKIAAVKENKVSKEAQLRRARDVQQLARFKLEKAGLSITLEDARSAEQARRAFQMQCDSISVTRELLTELRNLDRDRALAEERLRAAATRMEYKLRSSAVVRLAGKPIEAEGLVLVTENSDLEVDGVGTFSIHPGGEDLHVLRDHAEKLAHVVQNRLAELGMAELGEAEQALNKRENLQSQAKQHAARLNALAPQGLTDFEDRMATVENRCQVLQKKLGEGDDRLDDPVSLEHEISSLVDDIESLEVDIAERESLSTRRQAEVVEARATYKATQSRMRGLDQALESARKQASDAELAAALVEAQRETELRHQACSALERSLQAENPQAVALEVERSKHAFMHVKDEFQSLLSQIRDLSVELNTLGQRGLAEEFAQAQAEHVSVERELAHVEAHAKAIDLLHRTLDAALRSAKEKVAEPVIAKLVPYLRQLMPGAEPSISEDMVLTGIRRQSNAEPFQDLSIGTREQLAVLLRLAYADLLTEKGKPVTVILDDALVNSDDERRDRMKAILYQAAKKYQILVLTCHAKEYRDSGGKFIALAECKA